MATSKKTGGSAKKPAKKTTAKKAAPKKNASAKLNDKKLQVEKSSVAVGEPHPGSEEPRRRDFINIAAVSFAGVGGAAVALPLVSQMSMSADVAALASVEVDVSSVEPGQAIKTTWRKQPIFIRNLTVEEIAEAKADDDKPMRDSQPFADRTLPGKENWLVTLGVCTHLGCVPTGAAQGEVKGEYGGYFCPCHGSHYDIAGRIRKGPAPTNLVVPEFAFVSDTVIKIG